MPSIHPHREELFGRPQTSPPFKVVTLVCVSNGCHIAHFHQLFRRELPHIDNKINRIFSSLDTLLKIRTELNAWPKTIYVQIQCSVFSRSLQYCHYYSKNNCGTHEISSLLFYIPYYEKKFFLGVNKSSHRILARRRGEAKEGHPVSF